MKWIWIVLAVLAGMLALIALVGALLPKSHVAARTARFAQTPERIFELIHGFADYPTWRKDVSKVEILEDRAGKSSFREHASYGTITYVVDAIEPPHKMLVRIADENLAFGGTWTYDVVGVPGGAQLTITERGEVYNVIFRFLSRFVFSHDSTIDAYLKALGTKVGEQVTPEAA